MTTAALLLERPAGWIPALILAGLAAVTVAATVAVAIPAHDRLAAAPPDTAGLRGLLRANLVRTWAWTASAASAAPLLAG